MKEIILYKNKGICLIDDEDYNLLSKFNWTLHHDGYAQISIKINNKWGVKFMHQLLINTPKGMETDHIDHNKLNNQKFNLRIVTNSQNNMNRLKQNGEYSSKFKGIYWHKRDEKWYAQIRFNKKYYYLGSFKNEIDAAKAYNNKAKELFGKYACLNKI